MPNSPTYQYTDSLKQTIPTDTVYGIDNEMLIPIWHTEEIAPEKPLTIKEYHLLPIETKVENWQIIILLLTIFLLGIVKAFSNNRYRLGIKALVNHSVAEEITREESVFFHRASIFLTIGHTLSLSLFLFELRKIISIGEEIPTGFYLFLLIIGFIIIIYIVKYIFSNFLFFIFNSSINAIKYIFNVSLYNNLLGILLIPLLFLSYFTSLPLSKIALYLATPIFLTLFFLRLARLFAIGRTMGVLYVYIFLYICTLEILPLVILFRIFLSH